MENNVLVKDWNKPLSLQDVFNISWEWVKTHGPSAVYSEDFPQGRCLYRSDNGQNACFLGACIPDSLYNKEMENNNLSYLLKTELSNVFEPKLGGACVELYALQRCHDFAATAKDCNIEEFRNKAMMNLIKFAEEQNLQIPNV